MRELIRPTLFLVARLGLFFALVAWIGGQWQETECCIPLSSGQFDLGNCARGWIFKHHSRKQGPGYSFGAVREPDPVDPLRFGEDFFLTNMTMDYLFHDPPPVAVSLNVAGVVAGEMWGQRFLTTRHWLIITIFALFYGVLKWVYRKRGKELAANER